MTPDPTRNAELAALFTTEGAVVWQVCTGLEALSTFFGHTGEIDAILLDADLADLPRVAFLRRLRPHYPGVPCVFLVAAGQPTGQVGEGTWAVSRSAGPASIARAVAEAIAPPNSRPTRPSRI